MKSLRLMVGMWLLVVAARGQDLAPAGLAGRLLTTAGFWSGAYTQDSDGRYLGFESNGAVQFVFPQPPTYAYAKTGAASAHFSYHSHPVHVEYDLTFTSASGGTYTASETGLSHTSGSGVFTLARTPLLPVTNASARARIAPGGSAVLGLVVADTGLLTLTFRAAGPALAAFGVAEPMADPRLRVYRNGQLVGENDDWTPRFPTLDPVTSGPPGAFPFAAGSRDAALTIGAAPGQYTMVVDSADGRGGEVLLEAYASR